MQAKDVMTREVITVPPTAPIAEIAGLLLDRRISAVPVVDADDHVIGIVSEGDLMRRPEAGTSRRRSWWLTLFTDETTLAREFVKTHGLHAADIMTPHVVSVTETTDLRDIAELLEKHNIKRVPVVRDGRLVGLVSRADLLRAFVVAPVGAAAKRPARGDNALREEILTRIKAQPWGDTLMLNVVVEDGRVELWGAARSEEQRQAIRVLAERVPGVQAVRDELQVMPHIETAV
jgi:CBS domain-containing protein